MKLFLSPVKLIFITSLSSIPSEKSSLIFIGNSGIPKDELTQSDITNIFLGAKKNWNNGHKIIFVSLREGEAHKKFLRTYLNMTVREYETYWRQKKGLIRQ